MEVFQWSGKDLQCSEKEDQIKEELADIFNYCVLMSDICNLDIDEIILDKLKRNENKYPIEKAKNKKDKYTRL